MHLHRLERNGDPLRYRRKRTGLASNNIKEYYSYRHMLQRCNNPRCKDYKDYGGRGIKVCDRWLGPDGFENFLNDMGTRPGGRYSLDRKNVDGNYEPSNCRWTNDWTQASNQRRRGLMYRGVYKDREKKMYVANISFRGIRKTKYFKSYDDAFAQRLQWEKDFKIDIS